MSKNSLLRALSASAVKFLLDRCRRLVGKYQRAVALWQAQAGHSDELAESMMGLAGALRATGDFPGAERALRSALPLRILRRVSAARRLRPSVRTIPLTSATALPRGMTAASLISKFPWIEG